MSTQTSNSSSVPQKQLAIVVSRFGQIQAVYSNLNDAMLFMQDCVARGITFDLSAKFLQ